MFEIRMKRVEKENEETDSFSIFQFHIVYNAAFDGICNFHFPTKAAEEGK